jgi:eukaryotic-like serine/threonine-protein kinase
MHAKIANPRYNQAKLPKSCDKPMTANKQQIIQNRYVLEDVLGMGGMGVVFRAYDRLDNSDVALKRINVPPQSLRFRSHGDSNKKLQFVLYALTQEFQTLASLRHPNIIRVRDYGFDNDQNPFLTMDYLRDAQPLTIASLHVSPQQKIRYLIDVLQALMYLHQRGVIHRDLKPGNVLVADGKVYLLDFGLSVDRDHAQGRVGTMAYMAPEVVQQGMTSEQSDLYAIGVMAYELFADNVPFQPMDIMGIVSQQPDMGRVDASEPIALVIERLLAKDAADRYPSAYATLLAFCKAIDIEPPAEDQTIRESYLQAATFIGREDELQRLIDGLNGAKIGRGSLWLVGGESGVGKSRLLDELRTQALLKGTRVVRGQAVQNSSLPFQLWRSPLRYMVLYTTLSDVEAGILREVIPDIDRLLQRDIPEIPRLDGEAHQQRLLMTMHKVLQRQESPILILLEDLQWASESILLLQKIQQQVGQLPICIVGNYRSDERPRLPDDVPYGVQIQLERLEHDEIVALSQAMIGESVKQGAVIDVIEKETEGNVYFLVEVLRALAEEAGSIHKIGQSTIPAHIFSGGIGSVLRRRLSKIPQELRHLTLISAVVGRQVDVPMLDAIDDQARVDEWLTIAANAAVLDVQDGQWQFAHDKLRELLLAEIEDDQARAVHEQVATAIEQVYATDDDYIGKLAYHWYMAGDNEKAAFYGLKQAQRLLLLGNTRQLIAVASRLLASPDIDDGYRAPLYRLLGDAYQRTGRNDRARDAHENALALAETIDDTDTKVYAIKGLAALDFFAGDIDRAEKRLREALPYKDDVRDTGTFAHIINNLGVIARNRSDYDTADRLFTRALKLHRQGNSPHGLATTLYNVADSIRRQGQRAKALQYFHEIIESSLSIGNLPTAALAYAEIALMYYDDDDYANALDYLEKEMELQNNIENPFSVTLNYLHRTFVFIAMREYETAREFLHKASVRLQNSDYVLLQLIAVIAYARLVMNSNRASYAVELLGFVEQHEAGQNHDLQRFIERLLRDLRRTVPPITLKMMRDRETRLHLADLIDEMVSFTAHHLDTH